MNTFKRNALFAVVLGMAVLAVTAALGHPLLPHDTLASISAFGMAPFMVGEVTMVEVKKLIEEQGTAWEEFKKTNDAIIKAKADGKAVGDLETKLAKISETLDTLSESKAAMESALATLQRSGLGGGDRAGQDIEIEAKNFNLARSSWSSKNRPDMNVEDYKAYKSALAKCLREGKEALSDSERKAMLAGDDSNGGYLLAEETVGRIVKKVFELSPIRSIVSVQQISGPALEGLYDNDESSYGWVSEVGGRTTTTTPTLGAYRIEPFEMYADPKATQTLLDDAAIDVEAWLAGKVADKFARVEGAAFINGTGVGQPRGFTTYSMATTGDATRSWGTIEKVKSGANGDFSATTPADVLFSLIQAFKTVYLQNARWVTTREVIAKIRKFKEATTNAYMWQPGLAKGTPDTLLGYPIVMAQDVPALATGSASLWLGDWTEAYQIVDRTGIRTLRDPFTDKPYVHFYSTRRVGGGVLNFEALKALTFES